MHACMCICLSVHVVIWTEVFPRSCCSVQHFSSAVQATSRFICTSLEKGGSRDLLRWEGMTPTSLPPPQRTPCQEPFPRLLLFIKEIRLAPGSICSSPHQTLGNDPCCCTYSIVSCPSVSAQPVSALCRTWAGRSPSLCFQTALSSCKEGELVHDYTDSQNYGVTE